MGVPGAYWVFFGAGAGTLLSAAFSCTPTIVFGESFAGVLAGGRTGLTAFFMAALFLLTMPLHPILEAVPLFASAPVLVVLGSQLLALLPASCARKHLDFDDMCHAFPSFVTIVGMPFLSGIERGIASGLFCWGSLQIIDLSWRAVLSGLALLENAVCRPGSGIETRGLSTTGGAGSTGHVPSYQAVSAADGAAVAAEGGENFLPMKRTNTIERMSEGMPPRQSSFTKSPAPGVFNTPYEVARAARRTSTSTTTSSNVGANASAH